MRLLPRLAALPVLLVPFVASAVPRHVSISVKATKTGCTISCAAVTDNPSHTKAIVGLVPSASVGRVTRESARTTMAKVAVPVPYGKAKPVTIVITYGKDFQPGQKFHVISGWPNGSYTHVFGAVTTTSRDNEITLPGTMTPAMKAAKAQAVAQARAAVTTLKATHKTARDTLKAKQRGEVDALKARQLAARTRAKDAAAKKTKSLQDRIAAAKGTPKAATLRAQLATHRQVVANAASNLKWTQDRAMRTLVNKHSSQTWTLKNKQDAALQKLQQS